MISHVVYVMCDGLLERRIGHLSGVSPLNLRVSLLNAQYMI